MNLAMNEIAKYMQIYEQRDRYFEEGAINKLKDFFFFRVQLNVNGRINSFWCSRAGALA